jgi:S-adenosylmethionine hydrolase
MSLLAAAPARAAGPPTICLFTDFGWDDPYVAQLKGVIVTLAPNARILDLTHTVAPYNVTEGSYLLSQSAEEFPAGTIFVAVVDPQVGTERAPLLIETNQQKFFVGPDNGLFAQVIASEGLQRAWQLDKPEFFRNGGLSHTFHGRDIFAPVAAHLAEGTDPDRMGTPLKTLDIPTAREPIFAGGQVETEVVHIDRYGNVILNLRSGSEYAAKLKEGTLIRISIGRQNISAPLVRTYGDVEKGRLLLLYGGSGLLEISVNQGSAARQLKVEPGTNVYLKP